MTLWMMPALSSILIVTALAFNGALMTVVSAKDPTLEFTMFKSISIGNAYLGLCFSCLGLLLGVKEANLLLDFFAGAFKLVP
jgi:hypothetical protein